MLSPIISWLSTHLATIQNYTQFYAAILAIPLNLFLIFLILCHSPKELGAYRYLMIYISVFDVVYAVMDVVVSPFAHSYGSTFLVIVNLKTAWIGKGILSVLLSVYCGFYGCSMAIFGIHFVYRYFVASGSQLLKTFQSWKLAIWLSIPIVIGGAWSLLTYWPCMRREATDRYVEANIMETFGLNLTEIEYISPYFYELDGKKRDLKIYWPSFVGIGINSCIINASIFTIVYYGNKCYMLLKTLVPDNRTSRRNRVLQNQLFIALVTQTLIPVFLMHIPVSILYFCSFFSVELGSASGIAPVTIALFPALDPLPTVLIIKSYRVAVGGYLLWLPKRVVGKNVCGKNVLVVQ